MNLKAQGCLGLKILASFHLQHKLFAEAKKQEKATKVIKRKLSKHFWESLQWSSRRLAHIACTISYKY